MTWPGPGSVVARAGARRALRGPDRPREPGDPPAASARTAASLTPGALAFRGAHAAVAMGFLLAIAYVWWCAVTGRRGPLLRTAIAALTTEGALVAANGGDCPLGCVQARMGDPTPLFELVLSPRAAKGAVPVLGAVAALGIALVAARGRSAPASSAPVARPPSGAVSVARR